MTQEEFDEWRKNKLLYGMHWQRLIDRNTKELLQYNQTAVKYINGEVPQMFASGYNSVAEQIPTSPVAGFDFEAVNAETVSNLVHEDGIILPPKKKIDPEKDKAWNAKLINAQLLQGILQGETIPEMAKRMQTVANSDLAGATRTARTMHTAAQNAGRQSGYNKAAEQGVLFKKTWLAAMQERTRATHIALSGTTIAHDQKFESLSGVKLMFPGDWNAEGSNVGAEIYNCRCTMVTKFKGFKPERIVNEIRTMREQYHNVSEAEQDAFIQRAGNLVTSLMNDRINDAETEWNAEYTDTVDLIAEYQKRLNTVPFPSSEYNKLKKAFNELIRKREKLIGKQQSYYEQEMCDLLKMIRECGTNYTDALVYPVRKNKDVIEKRLIADALNNYPKDWIQASYKKSRIGATLVQKRGRYNSVTNKIYLSQKPENYMIRTSYHELGHRFEDTVMGIKEAEKRFYERRTKGEPLVSLKEVTDSKLYRKNEKTRVDKFTNPYMGKEYSNGWYELVSMGFQQYFTDPKQLLKDKDYAAFITGMLVVV